MTIIDLPEDILYHIISFLHPLAILRVRQVSRDFSLLTHERAIWANAYRNSSSFLPDNLSSESSAEEIERLVLQSIRLDVNWNSPQPAIAKQRLLTSNPNKTPNESIHLYHGRYLMVGSRSSFVFYDLDAEDWDQVIFGSGQTDATFTYYRANTDLPSNISYISAVAATRWPQYTIRIWRIDFTARMLYREADVPIGRSMSGFAKITSGWLIHGCNRDPGSNSFNAVLFHIATKQSYEVPVFVQSHRADERVFQIDYIITHSHIFLMYISKRLTSFEAYPLPDTSSASDTPILTRSHSGECPGGFTETSLVSSQQNVARLIGNAVTTPTQGMRIFDVVLETNGTITFSDGLYSALMPGYNIHVSHSKNGRIRGVCMAPTTFGLLRIDGTDALLTVTDLRMEPSEGPTAYDVNFDGFRGRLCLVRDQGIAIIDYV